MPAPRQKKAEEYLKRIKFALILSVIGLVTTISYVVYNCINYICPK